MNDVQIFPNYHIWIYLVKPLRQQLFYNPKEIDRAKQGQVIVTVTDRCSFSLCAPAATHADTQAFLKQFDD